MFWWKCVFGSVILTTFYSLTLQEEVNSCPMRLDQVFLDSAPKGNVKAGKITEQPSIDSLATCADKCCEKFRECNVAFFYNKTCYHVKCISNEKCLPLKRNNISVGLAMQLVNPVSDDESWLQALSREKMKDYYLTGKTYEPYNVFAPDDAMESSQLGHLSDLYRYGGGGGYRGSIPAQEYDEMAAEESRVSGQMIPLRPCTLGHDEQCNVNEVCVSTRESKIGGLCHCDAGFEWSPEFEKCEKPRAVALAQRLMQKADFSGGASEMDVADTTEELPNEKKKPLTISVASKELKLPDNEVTLSAFVVPDEKTSGDRYTYLWTLISQPTKQSNGTMTDQAKDKVKLSNLSEGVYEFKITVTGSMYYGEAATTVTVSPPNRINRPPQVLITPQSQTVKLPNSKAILDGSTSSDDDKIVLWHWEVLSAPIGYQATLKDTSTLELDNLQLPGNYTFKLTVTDSDRAQNSTTAMIQVLQEIDYPPESNAGPDVIIYHPQKNVTLNGTLSTDDHEIVAWEWTKDQTNDQLKPVDMQNTRTPLLQLSNLELGIYTFKLKVMDAKNQSSTATVHVFVKPQSKSDPSVTVPLNQTVNLPQTWVLLNASVTSSNEKQLRFEWIQVSGPSNLTTILNANESVANATSLKVGNYSFQILVNDVGSNNNATALQNVTVVQEINAPPKAIVKAHEPYFLPVDLIVVDGSESTDDLEIVEYSWKRDDNSIAIGNIVANSSREPKLLLTNVVAGIYFFTLTVRDFQGLSSSDSVEIYVNKDPLEMHLVELTLNKDASNLNQAELSSLKQKLMLLLGDHVLLHIRDIRYEQKTGQVVIIFYVDKEGRDGKKEIMPGIEVEQILKEKFWRDYAILGSSVGGIRTSICQNNCSGHGVCNPETRACMCETFWMPSIYYFWDFAEANCDWSILYVIIGVVLLLTLCVGACCGVTCLCRRSLNKQPPRVRPKTKNYSVLGTQDEENLNSFARTSAALSDDSDTDSDVLFETRRSNGGILKKNGDAKPANGKYAMTRLGRRIKT